MKKIQLIEAVQSWLASDAAGDAKGMYHPAEIAIHLNDVFNSAIYAAYRDGKKNSDFSQLDALVRTYECSVVSQVGAKAYAFLPFAPVQLPDGLGVQAVYDHADAGTMFAPVESDAAVIFAELDVDTMDSVPTYFVEQSNVNVGAGEKSHVLRLNKLPVAPSTLITSLDVAMIQNLEQMDDFDDISIPNGSEDSLVQQVISLMSKKPVPDVANDGVIAR